MKNLYIVKCTVFVEVHADGESEAEELAEKIPAKDWSLDSGPTTTLVATGEEAKADREN